MNMKKLLKSLVYAAYKEDATKFQDTARKVISQKTSNALDGKRREIASNMIKQ